MNSIISFAEDPTLEIHSLTHSLTLSHLRRFNKSFLLK